MTNASCRTRMQKMGLHAGERLTHHLAAAQKSRTCEARVCPKVVLTALGLSSCDLTSKMQLRGSHTEAVALIAILECGLITADDNTAKSRTAEHSAAMHRRLKSIDSEGRKPQQRGESNAVSP